MARYNFLIFFSDMDREILKTFLLRYYEKEEVFEDATYLLRQGKDRWVLFCARYNPRMIGEWVRNGYFEYGPVRFFVRTMNLLLKIGQLIRSNLFENDSVRI